MKTLITKTTVRGNAVTTTIGDQRVDPMDNQDCSLQIRRINNIPDDVANTDVLIKFKGTTDCTGLGGKAPRLEFNYAELGLGVIIK